MLAKACPTRNAKNICRTIPLSDLGNKPIKGHRISRSVSPVCVCYCRLVLKMPASVLR